MSESTPEERLTALRFLRRVQERDLARTDEWIAAEEQRATGSRPTEEQQPAPSPPRPQWAIQDGTGPAGTLVHMADCWASGQRTRPVSRAQAVEALAGGAVPCDVCRPDRKLS